MKIQAHLKDPRNPLQLSLQIIHPLARQSKKRIYSLSRPKTHHCVKQLTIMLIQTKDLNRIHTSLPADMSFCSALQVWRS